MGNPPLYTFEPKGRNDLVGWVPYLLIAGALAYGGLKALITWETPLGGAVIFVIVVLVTWGLFAGRARRIEIYRDRLVLVYAGRNQSIPFATINEVRVIGRSWVRWKFARTRQYFGSAQARMLQLDTYGGSSAVTQHITPYIVIGAADQDAFVRAFEDARLTYASTRGST